MLAKTDTIPNSDNSANFIIAHLRQISKSFDRFAKRDNFVLESE